MGISKLFWFGIPQNLRFLQRQLAEKVLVSIFVPGNGSSHSVCLFYLVRTRFLFVKEINIWSQHFDTYWCRNYFHLIHRFEVCEGYVSTPGCQSFCSQGGRVPGQVHPPRAGPGQVHPRAGTPPLGRYTPLGRNTPSGEVHPPAVHAGIRSTSGTHPTGMYSYLNRFFVWKFY